MRWKIFDGTSKIHSATPGPSLPSGISWICFELGYLTSTAANRDFLELSFAWS
jgi:hypothetical protein